MKIGPKAKSGRALPARLPLSRERIVAEALVQIERDGLAGFSTRKLGEALGVQAMSLYHHFPSKAHVLDAMVEYVIGQIEFPPDSMPVGDRLRSTMRSYRRVALRYPGFFPHLAVHRMNMKAGIEFIDRVMRLFNEACPDDPERATRLFRVAGYYLNGAALDEAMGYGRGPSAQEPVSHDWVVREHPAIAAAGRWFAPSEHEKTFEVGIEMLMRELGLPMDTGSKEPTTPPARARARGRKAPVQT
ncbi:MAG TPA: TetR family transcriptional regulator [Burkholderiaceae bacterium]|nr:TetR family transcriptional regulator [Burkholderiaceae bacterium]